MAIFCKIINLSFLLGIAIAVSSFKLDERKVVESLNPSSNHDLSNCYWVSLCDEGHQYLFSTEYSSECPFSGYPANWDEARDNCDKLGGYLVKIENRHENNCILVYVKEEIYVNVPCYWTSGALCF